MPARTFISLCIAVAIAAFTATAVAAAAITQHTHASKPKAKAKAAPKKTAPRGLRGLRGPTGLRGPQGDQGNAGARGVAGPPADRADIQVAQIDWQNGNAAGKDTANFDVPGIGHGQIKCSTDTQWVRVFPSDQSADTVMWTKRIQIPDGGQGTVVSVRTARREANTGPDFAEGMNRYAGEARSAGSFVGIISSRGDRTTDGGPTTPPTTFKLSWHWSFGDQFGDRCYVAARFITGNR